MRSSYASTIGVTSAGEGDQDANTHGNKPVDYAAIHGLERVLLGLGVVGDGLTFPGSTIRG